MKKYLILLGLISFIAINGYAQVPTNNKTGETKETEEPLFVVVEDMPEFPGGQEGLQNYMQEHVVYPEIAKKDKIQGTVFINFTIAKDGNVKDAQVLRGVHPELDKEALRVINEMPKWKPGMQKGKPVNVSYNLPVRFFISGRKVKNKKKK
jgi:protein TonB